MPMSPVSCDNMVFVLAFRFLSLTAIWRYRLDSSAACSPQHDSTVLLPVSSNLYDNKAFIWAQRVGGRRKPI